MKVRVYEIEMDYRNEDKKVLKVKRKMVGMEKMNK
jgi:hypothetical protein